MTAANGIRMPRSRGQTGPCEGAVRRNTLAPGVGLTLGQEFADAGQGSTGKESALEGHQGGSVKKLCPKLDVGIIRESQGKPHVSFIPNGGR